MEERRRRTVRLLTLVPPRPHPAEGARRTRHLTSGTYDAPGRVRVVVPRSATNAAPSAATAGAAAGDALSQSSGGRGHAPPSVPTR